jgi:hypothetical protein
MYVSSQWKGLPFAWLKTPRFLQSYNFVIINTELLHLPGALLSQSDIRGKDYAGKSFRELKKNSNTR